ncbi:MAG TPA: sensor histidine kinase [Acidimicrobiales bacterium]|nr:sensor histidine kinase [Acidimicrobiales bacterium]
MTAQVLPTPAAGATQAAAWFKRLVLTRLRDQRFWMVQTMVVVITMLHGTAELTGVYDSAFGSRIGLQHLLVLIYLVPVVYSSLRFGIEGGAMAGVSCIALSIPNVFLWHLHGFEWVIELSSMLVVIAVGVVVAAPVERERAEWRRAEDTSRRLELVNGILDMLVQAKEPAAAVETLLDRLAEAGGFDGVAVGLVEPASTAVRANGAASEGRLRAVVEQAAASPGADDGGVVLPIVGEGLTTYPLAVEGAVLGLLAVDAGRPTTFDDHALLAAVAHHLALELEHARVQRHERERLQGYARAVLNAQEAERARIARDLHDDVAQPLVQLGRGLGSFSEVDGVPRDILDRSEDLRDLSLSTLALVRGFAQHLRPSALDDLGLVPAVAAIAREHEEHERCRVRFHVEGTERRLARDTEVAAFRIVQEALRNVDKHAAASQVLVRLGFDQNWLRLWIEDDGVGIETSPAAATTGGGLGIDGMRERAEIVGGSFGVHPRAGGGTIVEARLPG